MNMFYRRHSFARLVSNPGSNSGSLLGTREMIASDDAHVRAFYYTIIGQSD